MGRILFRPAAVLLSRAVVSLLLCASSGWSAQPVDRPGRDRMVVEAGDPAAFYDAGRCEWFVRPGVLAEPEGGDKASAFSVSLLESATILPVNGPRPESLGPWMKPIMDALEKSLGSLKLGQPLVVAFTLSPRDEPACAVWSPQKLDEQTGREISRILEAQTQAPRPLFGDCHFAFVYHPPGMKEQDDPGIPAKFYPSWRESRVPSHAEGALIAHTGL